MMTTMTRVGRWTLVAMAALALAACSDGGSTVPDGDDEVTGPGFSTTDNPDTGATGDTAAGTGDGKPGEAASIDTGVADGTVVAGGSTLVTCVVYDGVGDPMEVSDMAVTVTPADGVTIDGMTLTLTRAGDVDVACTWHELTDPTPAPISVVPGPAVTSVATVTPSTTAAGEAATVGCAVEDAHGNAADVMTTVKVAPSTATVDGTQVSSNTAGDYVVTCAVTDPPADLEVVPGGWTVTPGAPLSMTLVFKPEAKAYGINQAITVTGAGEDAYGNVLEDIVVEGIDALPGGAHTVFGDDGDKIRFDTEAIYTVTGHAAEWPSLTAARQAVVDETPPMIIITSPARGYSPPDGVDTVQLEGTVTDNLGTVAWVEIMGQPTTMPPEGGPFSVTVPLKYGMTVLSVRAGDPYDLEAATARSAYWSSEYHPMVDPSIENERVIHAVVAALSQDGIDDGVHDPANPDDLATLLETLIGSIDIATLLPDPLTSFGCIGGDCTLSLASFTYSDPEISLTLMSGGLHVSFELNQLAADIELAFPCSVPVICPSNPAVLPGGMTIAKVGLEADVLVTVVDGELKVTTAKEAIDIYDVFIDVPDPTGGLLESVINGALDFVEPALIGVFEAVLPYFIGDLIGGLLDSFKDALSIDQELDLPALVGDADPNTLVIATEAADILFTPQYMRLALDAVAHTKVADKPYPDVTGSLRYDGCGKVGTLPVPPSARIAAGIHDDLLNQLVYAIWAGGTLSIDMGAEAAEVLDLSAYGMQLDALSVDPMLPIVVNSCSGANRAQIGDLGLTAQLNFLGVPSTLGLWLQADAELVLHVAENEAGNTELSFEILGLDEVQIDVFQNIGYFEGDEVALIELVKDGLVPLLLDKLAGDAAVFELPTIDLSSLSESIPAGTEIGLDIQSITREKAYLIVEGALK